MLKDQVKFIICIPCYLRSPSCVSIFDEYSRSNWPLEHKPDVNGWCGIVRAPFSFEVLIRLAMKAFSVFLSTIMGIGETHLAIC